VIVPLPNVNEPTAVRPVFGVTPKNAFPEPVAVAACESVTVFPSNNDKLAPLAVGATDSVNVVPSTIEATDVPAAIPAPVTNIPVVNPAVEMPDTVVLPDVTVPARVSPNDASVVPNGIPGPCTGCPTNIPKLLGTRTVALPELVVAICEIAAGAANVADVGVPAVAAFDNVTTPVTGS
jgi:hypothetical protein